MCVIKQAYVVGGGRGGHKGGGANEIGHVYCVYSTYFSTIETPGNYINIRWSSRVVAAMYSTTPCSQLMFALRLDREKGGRQRKGGQNSLPTWTALTEEADRDGNWVSVNSEASVGREETRHLSNWHFCGGRPHKGYV